MGGNVWGGQSPAYFNLFGTSIGGVDVACPAGSETNVIAIPNVVMPNAGAWQILVTGLLGITLGATPPTNVNVGARIGAGADFDNYGIAVGTLVASATVVLPVFLNSPPSKTAWFPSPVTVNISLTPLAQAVTLRNLGSRCFINFFRCQDF